MALGKLLQSYPLTANSIITAVLFGAGDLLAQVNNKETVGEKWDFTQTARQSLYGAAIAPVNRQWVQFLSKVKPLSLRVATDQILYAPAGVAAYFSAMALLEGDSLEGVKTRLQTTWWSAVKSNWLVWPAVQTINLGYVPVAYQVIVSSAVGVLWNGYLALCNWEARRREHQNDDTFIKSI